MSNKLAVPVFKKSPRTPKTTSALPTGLPQHTLRIWVSKSTAPVHIIVDKNSNLRKELLKNNLSPYGKWTEKRNCGGRGLCATCGIHIVAPKTAPLHWHDWLAALFGYPRLSCQITVSSDLELRLIANKQLWGKLWPSWPKKRW